MSIQWYPGHMAKARQQVQASLKLVDVALEILDARIPSSSRNPDIDEILEKKPRVVILNKTDLADPRATAKWLEWFGRSSGHAVALDSKTGKGIDRLLAAVGEMAAGQLEAWTKKGRGTRPVRVLIVGIPNVGKSSLINRLAGRNAARIGDKPGVTRGPQWIRLAGEMELLDTPGILWPKFEDPEVGFRLAVTGAIGETIFDWETAAEKLITSLHNLQPGALETRYNLKERIDPNQPGEALTEIGRRRGCILPGGRVDMDKAATILIKEFQAGKLGRFTLDPPPVKFGHFPLHNKELPADY
ncbi:MAG: ribosome biogenesis GTPase YlqF [Syntrophothermus sp.]